MKQRHVSPGNEDGPFAIKTDLGWSIVGITDIDEDDNDAKFSHRIITREVKPPIDPANALNVRSKVLSAVQRVTAKEEINPSSILKMMETDFIEPKSSKNLSYDDKKFLTTLDEGIHVTNDNHYEMPLPFKISNPVVPNNKQQALKRLEHLKKRLESDPSYHREYTTFMNEYPGQ